MNRSVFNLSHAIAAAACVTLMNGPMAWAQTLLPNVVELTAEQATAGMARGDFTSQDLTTSFLTRIATYDPTYKAMVSLNPDALAQARASDQRRLAGTPLGPLDGVPVVVKDNMDYAGLATTNGFIGFDSRRNGIDIIPGTDSSVVARFKAAGAVILGKTNLPDFANDGLRTVSSNIGTTLNPYNLNRAPGGSSGGSATAVSGSFAVLGLGTETGRSIHNPAGFQNLVGVRPTFGRVPIDGIYPLNGSFRDVAGPLTKTVKDAALTLDVIAGSASRDPLTGGTPPPPAGGFTSQLSGSALQGKRIGYFDNGFIPVFSGANNANVTFRNMDAATTTLYNNAIDDIRGEGATIVTDDYLSTNWVNKYRTQPTAPNPFAFDQTQYLAGLGSGAAFNTIEDFYAQSDAQGKPTAAFRAQMQKFVGAAGLTSTTTDPRLSTAGTAWLTWRNELLTEFINTLDSFNLDGLAFPINGKRAPTLPGIQSVDNPGAIDPNAANNDPLVQGTVNLLGIPGVITPAGFYDDNTPFGIIFLGRPWAEAQLLGYAYDYEQATNWRTAPTLVPEPTTLLAAVGLLFLGTRRRRVA
ncbi:MAG TPA: amidase family protein [Tepidisphaeraceae bacterium]|jgi:Asp-tRNA(Asn)/Glu-tRNA(Gln) amidotransferase A subunit family amidase